MIDEGDLQDMRTVVLCLVPAVYPSPEEAQRKVMFSLTDLNLLISSFLSMLNSLQWKTTTTSGSSIYRVTLMV